MKQLPSGRHELDLAAKQETPSETIQRLQRRIDLLEGEIRGAAEGYRQLERTYQHLSDTWMAFQATAKLKVRDVQRAEAVGEFSRLLLKTLREFAAEGQEETTLIQLAYRPGEFGGKG